tara:strand:- start:2097 stop:2624 length:528 start_codon:yes stop_codon:yes gene_type:complete
MGYEIITITPTIADGAHAAGKVFFHLNEVKMPARACEIMNMFMEVNNGGGEDSTKIGILFFQKNVQPYLNKAGSLNATADIDNDDFVNNKYIGTRYLMLDATASLDLNVIDTTALYYQCGSNTNTSNPDDSGSAERMILKGDAGSNTVYAAGIVHKGVPDFDGSTNIKIHIHVEY